MGTSEWLAICVSALALFFTVLSFWWMNWRPGKLNVGSIRMFAAGKALENGTQNIVIVTVPLIIWNSGARPIVIDRMRLAPAEQCSLPTLDYEAVDDKLTTSPLRPEETIERNYYFLPYVLTANEVIEANIVFEARNDEFVYEAKTYSVDLEAMLMGSSAWEHVKSFVLDFSELSQMELYNLNESYSVFPYHVGDHV